jgi:hypothetical protein
VLSFLMLLYPKRLFDRTRINAFLMFIGYSVVLVFLYYAPFCISNLGNLGLGQLCTSIFESRDWANDFLGRENLAVLWMFSSFVGTNIRFSGTKSKFWFRVGEIATFIFIVPFAQAILSHFPAPMGSSSWTIAFVIGLIYLGIEEFKHRRRKKHPHWVGEF